MLAGGGLLPSNTGQVRRLGRGQAGRHMHEGWAVSNATMASAGKIWLHDRPSGLWGLALPLFATENLRWWDGWPGVLTPRPLVPTLQALAATAVAASAINIGGGFTITQRMLDMFKRPGDPIEHNNLYAWPAGLLVGGYALGALLSSGEAPGITSAAYLASSALCIAAIGCLSNQASARTGVWHQIGRADVAVGAGTAPRQRCRACMHACMQAGRHCSSHVSCQSPITHSSCPAGCRQCSGHGRCGHWYRHHPWRDGCQPHGVPAGPGHAGRGRK